jgi:hypothetical protein
LYKIYRIQIKEQVGIKSSTVGSHRNADFLLKNMSNKYFVTYSSILMSVSENF